MKTLELNGVRYRIKKETPNLFLCQMINERGEDIGSSGLLISDMLKTQIWRDSGTRIISKSRLRNKPVQLKLF